MASLKLLILFLFFVNIFTLPIYSGWEGSDGSEPLPESRSNTQKQSEIAVSRTGLKKETSAKAFLKGTGGFPLRDGGFFKGQETPALGYSGPLSPWLPWSQF